jgi:hypothetical protein
MKKKQGRFFMKNFICKSIIKKTAAVFLLLLAAGALSATESTRRLGIFIGSNNGGRDRVLLRYAVSDAKSLSNIFGRMGGIAENDNILMVEPSIREINRQIDNIARTTAQSKKNSQRTELVFYYSGHSDENGILLNRERYGYADLRSRINTVDADMKIVILDSCSSGAMTRAKGGVKTQPFLFDSSVSATGYAILTSSSADEVSQESDSIESSYFTHSLMTGLRGAADSVGDGRVTLNELYRFAYAETMAKTETSMHGTQHPSYDIQISGSGDVVLTDIKEISASLVIAEDVIGRISIRDGSDFLVAELTKVSRKPMELGLEPGPYRIVFQQGDNFYRADRTLSDSRRTNIGMNDFTVIATAPDGRSRGNVQPVFTPPGNTPPGNVPQSPAVNRPADYPLHPVSVQILPGIDLLGNNGKKSTNNLLVGVFIGMSHNLDGIGAGYLGLINTGNIRGVQASGWFNYAIGWVDGIQASGILNYTGGSMRGVQGSGIVNYAGGSVRWIQGSGIINIAMGDMQGIQASGIANFSGGNVNGLQTASIVNYAGGLQGLQTGLVNIIGKDQEDAQGVQLGIVNISKSENVFPVGLVNIVKNGILHPSVYIDDMLFSNIGFRSGSKNFYILMNMGLGGDNYNGNPVYAGAENRYFVSRAGAGVEIPIRKAFIDFDVALGNIYKMKDWSLSRDDNWRANTDDNETNYNGDRSTLTFQLRLTAGYKFFKHFGLYGGVSYDYFYMYQDNSPDPANFNGLMIGRADGPHINKFGFFGGIQF